jgi:hypothetical protein
MRPTTMTKSKAQTRTWGCTGNLQQKRGAQDKVPEMPRRVNWTIA